MKLLLDQGLPRSAVGFLRDAGIDTVHVGDIGYSTADDSTIIEKGRAEGRIIVTLAADFHALLALSGAVAPSVIRIRREGLRGIGTARVILTILEHCAADLEQGALVTAQLGRIRVRRLPVFP